MIRDELICNYVINLIVKPHKMRNLTILMFLIAVFGCSSLFSQQTVGLFSNTIDSYNGYTLFAPMTNKKTYLINNCGEKVHIWLSDYRPGLSAYLLEDGTLLRTRDAQNTTFAVGGSGGGIEMLDWDGNVIWEYTISASTECHHHDIEYLSNGNILVIVWVLKSQAESIQAGRNICGATLWSEKIIEIEPDLVNGGGSIVWEWHAWDHLVQDFDETKDNYGTISISPELLDINFTGENPTTPDWLHINSIDYNEELDQIMLSCHIFSEIWIIDHSTTTAEAASHVGGTSNKGGDILYRWGNPQAYDQGSSADQLLFKQHDASWIEASLPDAGMIMIFNNQAGSPLYYSEVNVIDPPVDVGGNYTYLGSAFSPSSFYWTYQSTLPTDLYASNISGAQRLPNGNTLICVGTSGTFFEVDNEGNTVWEYVNPVSAIGIIAQEEPVSQNSVFRCYRYSVDYQGLNGHDLIPQDYIETGSTFECILYTTTQTNENEFELETSVYPNPARNNINISSNSIINSITIYNTLGEKLKTIFPRENHTSLNIAGFFDGIYLIKIILSDDKVCYEKVIIEK